MAEAYIYDAVRTPRGRGKKDGSLHEVPTVAARRQGAGGAARPQRARHRHRRRHHLRLRRSGRRGRLGDPARRRLRGRLRRARAGHADHRASAPPASTPSTSARPRSRRAPTRSSSPAASNRCRASAWACPAAPGSWIRRSASRLLHAAGRLGRPDRHQIRLLARRRRRLCGREPEARRQGLGRRATSRSPSCR